MPRLQQYTSVHSTATVRSEHSSHRALHEIFTTGSIISARSFRSPVIQSVTWRRLEVSHAVSHNSPCPGRLQWRHSACRSTVPKRLGINVLPSAPQRWGIRSAFVCIFICAQNCLCDPRYEFLAARVACGAPLWRRLIGCSASSVDWKSPRGEETTDLITNLITGASYLQCEHR